MKQIPGVVAGKQGTNSLYIPTIYSKSQNEWLNNFYKQNGYLGLYYILLWNNVDDKIIVYKIEYKIAYKIEYKI